MHWLGWEPLCELGFCVVFFLCVCVCVWKVASGPGVGLASCGGALGPRWFALPAVLGQWSRYGKGCGL